MKETLLLINDLQKLQSIADDIESTLHEDITSNRRAYLTAMQFVILQHIEYGAQALSAMTRNNTKVGHSRQTDDSKKYLYSGMTVKDATFGRYTASSETMKNCRYTTDF